VKEIHTHTHTQCASEREAGSGASVVKGFVVERERECFVLFCFFFWSLGFSVGHYTCLFLYSKWYFFCILEP